MNELVLPKRKIASLLEIAINERKRRTSSNSLAAYIKAAWPMIEPKHPFVSGWHIDAISEHLEAVRRGQIRNLLINIPPRHAKSTIVSVAFPSWVWSTSPEFKFMYGSHSYSLSKRDSVKTRSIVQSHWYKETFGIKWELREDQNEKSNFVNTLGGSRRATSVQASIIGEGADCFPKGTNISTLSGYRDISEIQPGDEVWAYNHENNRRELRRVEAVRSKRVPGLVQIETTQGRSVFCTPEHRFFTNEFGYRKAIDLEGTSVVIEKRIFANEKGNHLPSVLALWKELRTNALRLFEVAEDWVGRRLLLEDLLTAAPLIQESKKMRDLFGTGRKENTKVLQEARVSKKHASFKRDELQHMRSNISTANKLNEVLLDGMQEQESLQNNESRWKFKLQTRKGIRDSISEDEKIYKKTGSQRLFTLFFTKAFGGSPRKREQKGQSTGKLNNALRLVSRFNAQIKKEFISSVRGINSGEVEVYDIQVEGLSNFFANGILVHNCLILDDPHSPRSVRSEVQRETELDWIDQEFFTRINDPKTVSKIIIMQRLDERDASAHVLAKGDWEHLMLPAQYEPDRKCHTVLGWEDPRTKIDEPLWPARFDASENEKMKRGMGAKAWAGQGQQRPAPSEGTIFKRKDLAQFYTVVPDDLEFFALSIDLPFDQGGSYAVFQVWGRKGAKKYLLDQIRGQVGFTQQQVMFRTMNAKWPKINARWIEKKANGAAMIDTLQKEFSGLIPVEPRGSKEVRAEAVSPQFEAGDVFLPDPSIAPWINDYIEELVVFNNGKFNDQVDATTQALMKLNNAPSTDWVPISMTGTSKWLGR